MPEELWKLKNKQIAERIAAHLKRFEADPVINKKRENSQLQPYFMANAFSNGRYIGVTYISFQHCSMITKTDACVYLRALDAGFVGTHRQALDAARDAHASGR